MFPMIESFTGKPIDREYAEKRAKWERLYEATQIKGDGETHPFLSPNDEFADFERWDKGNLDLSELKKPEMLEFEYARSALQNGLKLETGARHQSVQVRHDRLDRRAHRPGRRRGGQLLRQDVELRAEPDPRDAPVHQDREGDDHGLGADGLRLCRGLGDREHARGALRRDGAPRDLRHHRPAHDRALLRRLGLRRRRTPRRRNPAVIGYRKGVPMGGDLAAAPAGQGADLPRRRAQGSDRRQPRPLPDHQGLARRQGRSAREDLRRRLVGRPQARRRRQAARRSATPSTCRTRPRRTPSAPPS